VPIQIRATAYLGYDKFFRSRLLTLPPEKISELIEEMKKESATIKEEALKMAWYMRGGISYDQALHLSSDERTLISDLIKENLDTTKKSGLPFF